MFLASEASDFVNGLILYVDGGILAYIGKQPAEPDPLSPVLISDRSTASADAVLFITSCTKEETLS